MRDSCLGTHPHVACPAWDPLSSCELLGLGREWAAAMGCKIQQGAPRRQGMDRHMLLHESLVRSLPQRRRFLPEAAFRGIGAAFVDQGLLSEKRAARAAEAEGGKR